MRKKLFFPTSGEPHRGKKMEPPDPPAPPDDKNPHPTAGRTSPATTMGKKNSNVNKSKSFNNAPSRNTFAIRDKAVSDGLLLTSAPPSSAEEYKAECLDREACEKKGFVKLTSRIAAITEVDVAEAMVECYGIWPEEVRPCVDRKRGLISFEVLIGKKNVDLVANKPPMVKGVRMSLDDCRDSLSFEYELRGVNARFEDKDVLNLMKS